MTNEERWKVEGRTRDALRETRKLVAALKIEIEEYATKLHEASETLRHFLSHPSGSGPTGMTSLQYSLYFFRNAIPPDIEAKMREFEKESERLKDLEAKVSEFD